MKNVKLKEICLSESLGNSEYVKSGQRFLQC